MPAKITKKSSGKFVVRTPHGVKAKATTLGKATKQKSLLNAVDHGWVPTSDGKMKKTTAKIMPPKAKKISLK